MSTMLKNPEARTGADPGHTEHLWDRFVQPSAPTDFLDAWLGLMCAQISGATTGVVLLQSIESGTFAPVALWPPRPRDLSHLSEVAQKALGEGRGTVQRRSTEPNAPLQIAYPIGGEVNRGAVVLEVARADSDTQEILRTLHWGTGWLQEFLLRASVSSLERTVQRIGSVMEVVATALRRGTVRESLFGIANEVAQHLACSRVVIGLLERATVKVAAMSDAAWFETNADATKRYAAAMEECLDRAEPIRFDRGGNQDKDEFTRPAHAELAEMSKASAILTLPLNIQERTIGVLILERVAANAESQAFGRAENEWLEALASLLPTIIEERRGAERGFASRFAHDTGTLMSRLFGPRYLLWKVSASAIVMLVCCLTLIELDYRVTAKTSIEGEIQRAAVAPFEGFIATAAVRAGDIVKKGDVLCTLDDRELRLERDRWLSEREQRLGELRAAMAQHELTQVQITTAQLHQAEAQFALATEQIQRAEVKAPFDGIVISGDLSQLIGSPVETGKKLFEVAPLTEYRVILQVDESEMRHIREGQPGALLISGITDESLSLHVSKITPVATAKDGHNYFRVEAQLDTSPPNLRPGMEGIGKISVGERRLWWILTHDFTSWLRIWLWKWMP